MILIFIIENFCKNHRKKSEKIMTKKSAGNISFIGTPAKHGDYYIFHIPNKLIKKNLIHPDQTYQLDLKPLNPIQSNKVPEAQNPVETIEEESS